MTTNFDYYKSNYLPTLYFKSNPRVCIRHADFLYLYEAGGFDSGTFSTATVVSFGISVMFKFVYGFNWFCIGLLALFVLVLLLEPNRGGGDAATKGIGSGLLAAAIIAIVILLALNLSPWAWTKYVPPGLVLLLIFYFFAASGINILRSQKREKAIQDQPYFKEPELERMARIVEANDTGALRQLLQSTQPDTTQLLPILWFAIYEVPPVELTEKRLQCIKLLTDAGAPLEECAKDPDILEGPAGKGNPAMLRFLFEQGVDPNAHYYATNCPFIFAAITSRMDPMGSVLTFLEFGADPNITSDCQSIEPITPLIYAAIQSQWDICIALIEHGAKAKYQTPGGESCAKYVNERLKYIESYESEKTRLERLQALLR